MSAAAQNPNPSSALADLAFAYSPTSFHPGPVKSTPTTLMVSLKCFGRLSCNSAARSRHPRPPPLPPLLLQLLQAHPPLLPLSLPQLTRTLTRRTL